MADGDVVGLEFFAFGRGGATQDDWIGKRVNCGDGEHFPIAGKVDSLVLEEVEVSFVVPPWTCHCHQVHSELANYSLNLFVGGFTKDACEDEVRHLGLDAVCRHGGGHVGSVLGAGGSAKGRCLVRPDDYANDANEDRTGCSVPVFRMGSNVGYGYTADDRNGSFDGWFCGKFKAISIVGWGVCWDRVMALRILKCFSNVC